MKTLQKKSMIVLMVLCICMVFSNSKTVSYAKDDKIKFAWFTDTQNLSYYKLYSVIPYVTPGTIYNSLCDKIKEDYKININGEYTEYFNPNFYYLLEKFSLENNSNIQIEIYTECFTGEDISIRENIKKDDSLPDMFEVLEPLPKEYLTKEEIKDNRIRTLHLFQIFQMINYQNMMNIKDDKVKVKSLGKKD